MSPQQFSEYRSMVTRQAQVALDRRGDADVAAAQRQRSVRLALPGARLLVQDGRSAKAPPQVPETQHYAALSASMQALAELGEAGGPVELADSRGHHRPVYYPLVVHLCLAAFDRRYESMPVSDWGACEASIPGAVAPLRVVERWADTAPPPGQTDLALWQVLCLAQQAKLLSRDTDIEWSDTVVHQVVNRAGPDGSLHPREADAGEAATSLDAWVYRELCGLHALANLALIRRNSDWARRVQEVARYHMEHTQPDNTTTQPWALFAFLWSPATRPFAEQQLHDLAVQAGATQAAGVEVVSTLLLADAADALARFEPSPSSG